MDKKQISMINKAFDSLYDVNSKFGLFQEQLTTIEDYMKSKGYKVKINGFDKCVFVKDNHSK